MLWWFFLQLLFNRDECGEPTNDFEHLSLNEESELEESDKSEVLSLDIIIYMCLDKNKKNI